jgi:hypothetical protein
VERMGANSSRVHRGANLGENGVSLSWWTGLPTGATSISNCFSIFQIETIIFVFMEIGINSMASCASPSIVGFEQKK